MAATLSSAHRFGLALFFVTWSAQGLHIRFIVCATLCEWDDVIALRGQRYAPKSLALNTQRLMRKQIGTHRL